MPYGDSPVDNENVGEQVYMDIINTAKDYVHIMTPYLILDNEMMTDLKYACKNLGWMLNLFFHIFQINGMLIFLQGHIIKSL